MPPPSQDTNVAFSLTVAQRQQAIRSLTQCVAGMPTSSAILIDRAGRIVGESQRPMGVDLPSISALAAGCYATTSELATTMGQSGYHLVFQQDNGQQVFIWPVSDRALLVVLMRDPRHGTEMERRLDGDIGRELTEVISRAQEPEKRVPPPKVVLAEVPEDVRQKTRTLTAILTDLQTRGGGNFSPEITRYMLRARDDLVKALSTNNWVTASVICENTVSWLSEATGMARNVAPGKILPSLYGELLKKLHGIMLGVITPERLMTLYRKFHFLLARKWPLIFPNERYLTESGPDAAELWKVVEGAYPDKHRAVNDYIQAVDEMVRELLRAFYLVKGADERRKVATELEAIVDKYQNWLLPLGVDGLVGHGWTALPASKPGQDPTSEETQDTP